MIALTSKSAKSARFLCAMVSLTFILDYFGRAECILAAEAHQPFASFNAEVDIDIEDGEIEVMATFTLGANSNRADPAKENVTLQVMGGTGAYSVTIPAGSFKLERGGEFGFRGTISGVKLIAAIRPLRSGAFEFEVVTERAKLNGMANPVTVSLTIGDDSGRTSVRAKIE